MREMEERRKEIERKRDAAYKKELKEKKDQEKEPLPKKPKKLKREKVEKARHPPKEMADEGQVVKMAFGQSAELVGSIPNIRKKGMRPIVRDREDQEERPKEGDDREKRPLRMLMSPVALKQKAGPGKESQIEDADQKPDQLEGMKSDIVIYSRSV